jgi:hypothetical protein
VKKPSGPAPLTRGIDALARAAGRGKARLRRAAVRGSKASGFVLLEPPSALAAGELLIAVADAGSVVLQRVKVPASRLPAAAEGTPAKLAEIARRLAEIELIAAEIAQPAGGATAPPPPLTEAEERLLREAGLDPRPLALGEAHPVHRATAEYARLLHDSYTAEDAADLLGVNASRIRQRLTGAPRTLYGIKAGRGWRIPKFQFHGRRLVPGIERAMERLAPDLHPVAVYRWFTSPNSDLTRDGDTPMSPLDWLRVGNPPDSVAELAAGL